MNHPILVSFTLLAGALQVGMLVKAIRSRDADNRRDVVLIIKESFWTVVVVGCFVGAVTLKP